MKQTHGLRRAGRWVLLLWVIGAAAAVPMVGWSGLSASQPKGDGKEEPTAKAVSVDPVTGKILYHGPIPAGQDPKRVPGTVVPWRQLQDPSDLRCGVKALFVFLRMHDVPVTLTELEQELTVGKSGVDMLQLKDAAAQHGVKAEVVECSPSDLEGRLPAIIRLSEGSGSDIAHYYVLTGLSEQHCRYVEPTSGRFERGERAWLGRYFSGYALLPARRGTWAPLVSFVLGVIVCGQVAVIGSRWWRRRRR